MKKTMVKTISIILAIIILLHATLHIFPLIAIAATKSELENEKSNLNSQIKDKEEEIEEIEEEISNELEEAKKITNQIYEYEEEIDELEDQIADLETQIDTKTTEISEKEAEYTRQKELLDEKVIAMAEGGETTYLDVMFASASLSEMISNYYLMSEVIDYDISIMEDLQKQKEEIENEKSELELDKTELDVAKDTLESKMGQLKVAKSEKEKAVAKLTDAEKEAQASLEEYEASIKEIDDELEKIAKEEAARLAAETAKNSSGSTSYISGNPSSCGYIFPIAGKSKSNITTGYGKYSWGGTHTGVDIAVSAGTPIYAVKDGTVVKSKALINDNGNYYSYGEYIVINHGDGTMTLYGHGLAGSRLVEVGDSVKQGQQIMSVGSTGNSSGNHLHFEVKLVGTNGTLTTVNPTPYLP